MTEARLPDFPGWNRLTKTNKPKVGDRIDFIDNYVPPFEWTLELDWYVIREDELHLTTKWGGVTRGFGFDYWRISKASNFDDMMRKVRTA
jgi:hypothetical protein